MNSKNHSIAVIGHGELNLDLLDGMHGFVDSFNLITSLIGNDDNSLPYLTVPFAKDEVESAYTLEDIDFIISPLYDRVHQEYKVLY